MTNLTHTPPTRPLVLAADEAERARFTNGDITAAAKNEPYVALQSEAHWYGNSLWEYFVPSAVTGGKLSVFQSTMPEGFFIGVAAGSLLYSL